MALIRSVMRDTHWYVDNEIVAAARQREVFGAALDSIVEHLHPTVGKADNDEVYETGSAHKEEDRLLFSARFRLYGPPPRRVPPLRRLLRRSRLLLNRS